MSFRVVYGNSISENGWRMCNQDACTWSTIPGSKVSIQLRSGIPTTILVAFAAQFNKLIEPLRDADTAGWTLVNDVGTSNHLAGTAMDLNWNTHPFHARGTFGNKLPALRDLLDSFDGAVFWGGDWRSPIDEMHFQMGWPEGDKRYAAVVNKLLGGAQPPPPVPPPAQPGKALAALTDAEQRELLDLARQQSGYRHTSRSPLRYLGEGPTETVSGFQLNMDGSVHILLIDMLASLGHPQTLALLTEIANADPVKFPDRQNDRKLAQAILTKVQLGTANVAVPQLFQAQEPVVESTRTGNLPDELAKLQGQIKSIADNLAALSSSFLGR